MTTIYRILRKDGNKVEWYFPHESFSLDNWTSQPQIYQWNTSLVAVAIHIANVERERERLMWFDGSREPREIMIQAKKGNQTWIVNEDHFSYAGVI